MPKTALIATKNDKNREGRKLPRGFFVEKEGGRIFIFSRFLENQVLFAIITITCDAEKERT